MPIPQYVKQNNWGLAILIAILLSRQLPIGSEDKLRGLVDLTSRTAFEFHGAAGETITPVPLPPDMAAEVDARRAELVERVRF